MSARISLFNLQNSMNPYGQHQESNPLMVRNNQNSISFFERYSYLPRQQESRSLLHIQAIMDNFFHKNDSIMSREDNFTYELIFQSNDSPFVQELSSQSASEISESSLEIPLFELKKGLKNLAKLLIRILRKKKFDSSKNLTSEIQQILMKGKKLSKNELARQSKNIRRRTYDALNVMVAANVLGPDLAFVRRINTSSFTKKCGVFVGETKQLQNKISDISDRIKTKKMLLNKLQTKKSAIKWWIQKNIDQSSKQDDNQQLNFKTFKNEQVHLLGKKSQKVLLPALFIHSIDEKLIDNFQMKNENLLTINSKNREIKLFSEIDAFQILKQQSQLLQQSPIHLEKSKHLDFRSFETTEKDKCSENQFIFNFFNK